MRTRIVGAGIGSDGARGHRQAVPVTSSVRNRLVLGLATLATVTAIIGGRTAAGIPTPIPSVRLLDLLWIGAVTLALPDLRHLWLLVWSANRRRTQWLALVSAFVVFVGIGLIWAVVALFEEPTLEDLVRGLAFIWYVGSAPIVAYSIATSLESQWFIAMVRVATALSLVPLWLLWNFALPEWVLLKADFSGAILGLGFVSFSIATDAQSRAQIAFTYVMRVVMLASILTLPNRAGLLVGMVGVLVGLYLSLRVGGRWQELKMLASLAGVVAAATMLSIGVSASASNAPMPATSSGAEVRVPLPAIARLAPITPGDAAPNLDVMRGALGTVTGRTETWNMVAKYVLSEGRLLTGLGPTADILTGACGGPCAVAGSVTDLRSPHNIWLSTWATFGLVALVALVATVLFTALVSIWSPAVALAWSGIAGLLLAATVGVVLEAPNGGIVYAFLSSYVIGASLLASGRSRRVADDGSAGPSSMQPQ